MASVDAHRWREGRICKAEGREGKPPHGKGCKCKVTAWRARWRTPEGASRSEVFEREADAKGKAAEMETKRRTGVYVDRSAGRQLFESYAQQWAEVQEWKGTTRDAFPYFLNRVRSHVGGMRLGAFDKMALERTKLNLSAKYKRTVVEGDMHRIGAILRHAYANGRIPRDPTVGFEAAPKRRGDETEGVSPDDVPTTDEVFTIWRATVSAWRASVALGSAGLRIGEVLGMRRDRVALDENKITVDGQAVRRKGIGVVLSTTKNEKTRTIEVDQLVTVELRRHLREGHGGAWEDSDGHQHEMLFLRESGRLWSPNDFYREAWWPALTAAKLPERRFKFHALRHWCASTLLAEGVELPTVAGYIGDHQQTVLRTYSHWLRDRQHVPATVIAAAFARATVTPPQQALAMTQA